MSASSYRLAASRWLPTAAAAVLAAAAVIAVVAAPAAATAAPAPPPGGTWVAVPPASVFTGTVAAGATKAVTVTGVPAGAAAWLTVSETGATKAGALLVYPAGGSVPTVASVAFAVGQAASDAAVVTTSSRSQVAVRNTSAAAVTVRVDVSGYYQAGAPAVAGGFGPVAPTRVANGVHVPAGGSVNVTVAGTGGIPSGAAVVLATLTVTAPTAAGTLTAYPRGAARPDTQSLLYSAGRPGAALGAVRVGTAGQITVINTGPSAVTLTAAVSGYYLAGTPHVGRAFTKTAPAHLLDTSTGLGVPKAPVAANGIVTGTVTGTGTATVPASGVLAVVLQVSASAAKVTGSLAGYPAGGTVPGTPSVEFSPGRGGSALLSVPVSSTGRISLHNASSGTVQARADLVGYVTYATGFTWTAPARALVAPPALTGGVSCPTATFCLTVDGDGNTVRWNGSTWARTLGGGPGQALVSCVSATFCLALDGSGVVSRWTGTGWVPAGTVPVSVQSDNAQVLSCLSVTFCVATGGPQWTFWNGTSWSAPTALPGQYLESLSCGSPTMCVAMYSGVTDHQYAVFDGATWSALAPIAGLPDTGGAVTSCAGATFCVARSDSAWASFDGSSWSAGAPAPTVDGSMSLTCLSSVFCAEVDDDGGQIVVNGTEQVSTFTGAGWTAPVPFQTGTQGPSPTVTCASVSLCWAVGDGLGMRWTGSGWQGPAAVDPDRQVGIAAIECLSPSWCAVASKDVIRIRTGAGAWGPPARVATSEDVVDFGTDVEQISCVSMTFCMAAIGGGGNSETAGGWARWNGSTWSVDTGDQRTSFDSVSCVSMTWCVAVGLAGNEAIGFTNEVWTWRGSSWSRTAVLPDDYPVQVSCVSTTHCVAVGTDTWTVYDGTKWSAQQTFPGMQGWLTGMSCQSVTFCVAVSTNGQARTFNGTGWSQPAQAASDGLDSVSCAQPAACVAVGADGAVQYRGQGVWGLAATVDPGHDLGRVSCPSSQFCLAVDERGFETVAAAN